MTVKYTVFRDPVLQEDEGRYQQIETFNTRADAEAWISKQEGEYFGPHCYRILEAASA